MNVYEVDTYRPVPALQRKRNSTLYFQDFVRRLSRLKNICQWLPYISLKFADFRVSIVIDRDTIRHAGG